jgi:hypothetical protein
MATTREDIGRVDLEDLLQAPQVDAPPMDAPPVRAPPDHPTRPRISEAVWRWGLFGGWMALILIAVFAEPSPNPEATTPLWAQLLGVLFLYSVLATFIGLSGGRPWGFGGSVGASALGFGMAAACGITDHHLGAWWIYEMVAFGALLAVSIYALRSQRG